jgi:hypothetical protein
MKVQRTHIGERTAFSIWYWENWISTHRRMKLDPYLSPVIKINSKLLKDLNVRPKIEATQRKHRENTLGHWSGQGFFNKTQKQGKQKQE